ncbi:MAG TPA: response regulator transcription factor, partial [Bryobacteraceae bacterium]|nr:response regulator transcription factor [Bryobacteraceae bacterium]
STKLIFLSMYSSPLYVRKALDAGASAYVLKTGAVEELGKAIGKVLAGEIYFSPELGNRLDLLTNSGKSSGTSGELTDRQWEVLRLISEGKASKEIAHILGISTKTVDFHRARIMTRMGAHSVAELVRAAVELGFIPASGPTIHEQTLIDAEEH